MKDRKYRHYKGGIYTVFASATHAENGDTLIIYKCENGLTWASPAGLFLGYLEDGTKRFTLIED